METENIKKQDRREYYKQYYRGHKDKWEGQRDHVQVCEICGTSYRYNRLKRHEKTKKHQALKKHLEENK